VKDGRRAHPGQFGSHLEDAHERQQSRQARAIVGNAGAVKAAVRLREDLFRGARREDGIEMRRDGHVGARRIGRQKGDHVARRVDGRLAAQRPELLLHPFGALLFEKGRRRDPAQRQVFLVHPLLVFAEQQQRLFDSARAGERGDAGDARSE